jgi:hypothetical protein
MMKPPITLPRIIIPIAQNMPGIKLFEVLVDSGF